MRTLIFNVKNQIIERKAGCDFGGLVADTTPSSYFYELREKINSL